jgi:HD-GYP domain-containing protein (c-di-GMP phosphodiesterase class II)
VRAAVNRASTKDRPYRKALPRQEAFAIMREEVKRGWWDAPLVEEFEGVVQDARSFEAGKT